MLKPIAKQRGKGMYTFNVSSQIHLLISKGKTVNSQWGNGYHPNSVVRVNPQL